MLNYKEDVKNTISIIQGDEIPGYDSLFFSSNEDLKSIFYGMDFTDKRVLSVLASGDQTFYFLDHNAKHVDLFDINKLTIYLFYLRIWCIEQYNTFHLPHNLENTYIINLLNRVTPLTIEEEIAHNYWQELADTLFINCMSLYNIMRNNPKELTEIKDLDRIKEQVKNRSFNFYNIDISQNSLGIKEKYDIIYLSNIIDWLIIERKGLSILANNLNNLLSESGTIICADLARLGRSEDEELTFDKYFRQINLPICRVHKDTDELPPGYCYIKKKNNKI